ncbi:hypothetical protein CYLTODRAFT_486199 [Cylindrobasidium torrendii FP15055 ss-10]|uniref:Uncharacterized protein n=1 Tax=Cylindrobasidium torrendii FP15055 ss-10 TaxID=1314674 RepID=A0A0D7BSG0_9AGAR|nr:hypothetical protein CYLTODRAFT_486199 [Cylindrobasidium torrendii FP15055 ss-10]
MSLSTALRTVATRSGMRTAGPASARYMSHNSQSAPVEGAPGWSETDSTESEAAVKAEKHGSDAHPQDLQRTTVRHIHREKHEAHLNSDANQEAAFDKEDLKGPLEGKGR